MEELPERGREEEKQKYKEEVQADTQKLIGTKLSLNTPKFTPSQIENGELVLKNSALFRVVTKWVQELEECFHEDKILEREYPFRMMGGNQRYLDGDELDFLNKILQELKRGLGGPD